jgi:hypothetical protein
MCNDKGILLNPNNNANNINLLNTENGNKAQIPQTINSSLTIPLGGILPRLPLPKSLLCVKKHLNLKTLVVMWSLKNSFILKSVCFAKIFYQKIFSKFYSVCFQKIFLKKFICLFSIKYFIRKLVTKKYIIVNLQT